MLPAPLAKAFYRDKQVLFDTKGTTVRAQRSKRPLPDILDQLFPNIDVGLEHLEEAVWFEHLKIEGTTIHQHPLGAQKNRPAIPIIFHSSALCELSP